MQPRTPEPSGVRHWKSGGMLRAVQQGLEFAPVGQAPVAITGATTARLNAAAACSASSQV
ncbi:MAG: hypothetical protein LM550_06320 [Candidatus Contendobacter sp.]|nr:hypothetical protein [Candidatus Contendobacter sp.]